MKALKIAAIVILVYVGIVVAFESLIGTLQPTAGSTLVITTFDPDGTPHDRVVSRLLAEGHLYVAANHWPRAWYKRALESPEVQATLDGKKGDYRAVPVTGVEHERVDGENSLGVMFRILTGFPPRYFVRLDPREAVSPDGPATPPLPERTDDEPSCRTAGSERDPTDAWVQELQARADATQMPEDVRKAMKAALLVLVEEDEDCWEVRDGFDSLCGKPNKPAVTIECQQWWDRAFKSRSEQRASHP